jgi:hypothetical protein
MLTPRSHRDEFDGGSTYESKASPAQKSAVLTSNLLPGLVRLTRLMEDVTACVEEDCSVSSSALAACAMVSSVALQSVEVTREPGLGRVLDKDDCCGTEKGTKAVACCKRLTHVTITIDISNIVCLMIAVAAVRVLDVLDILWLLR